MNENMLPVGTVLRSGTYRIEKQIGSGGFGNTYMVRHLGLDDVQAMKEFFMKEFNLRDGMEVTVSIPGKRPVFEAQRSKFKKEARRLWEIKNPHIVKVHDLFEENGTVYYIMDYIDGNSLSDIVKAEGPMSEGRAMDIFRQMLEALEVVHGKEPKMLHLDIKPANIMVDKKGNAFLLDFGSSKQIDLDGGLTTDGSGITLSKGFAPTELIDQNRSHIGPWTDLYELGATLYYLVTGQQPPSVSEIQEEGEKAFSFPDAICDDTRELILWMMAPTRSNRPKSVDEVLNHLERMGTSGGQVTKSPESESKKSEEPKEPVIDPDNELTILNSSGISGIGDDSTIYNPSGTDGGDKPKEAPQPLVPESKWITWGNSSLKDKIIGSIIGLAIVAGIIYWEESIKGKSQPAGNDTEVIKSVDETEHASSQLNPVIQNLMNNMVYVSGGTFTMGATNEQGSDVEDDERPAHQVILSSYSIGKYEVTQEEWEAVMGSNPSVYKGAKRPVENVSWWNCQEFIRKLNAMTGKKFRLPTEAEWEYAARGGMKSKGYKFSGSNDLRQVAWYDLNSEHTTVGTKRSNELGLFDMSGNVWEWCQDYWCDRYSGDDQTNPTGPASGSYRVIRGGSWITPAGGCRVSYRGNYAPAEWSSILGFRLAL